MKITQPKPANKKTSQTKNKQSQDGSDNDATLLNWKLWNKQFSRQGLGGHMSRAHPGLSQDYRKKKETRKNREKKLEVLRLAQKLYRVRAGNKSMKGIEMNRTKLNKYRDEIIKFYKENPGKEFPLN